MSADENMVNQPATDPTQPQVPVQRDLPPANGEPATAQPQGGNQQNGFINGRAHKDHMGASPTDPVHATANASDIAVPVRTEQAGAAHSSDELIAQAAAPVARPPQQGQPASAESSDELIAQAATPELNAAPLEAHPARVNANAEVVSNAEERHEAEASKEEAASAAPLPSHPRENAAAQPVVVTQPHGNPRIDPASQPAEAQPIAQGPVHAQQMTIVELLPLIMTAVEAKDKGQEFKIPDEMQMSPQMKAQFGKIVDYVSQMSPEQRQAFSAQVEMLKQRAAQMDAEQQGVATAEEGPVVQVDPTVVKKLVALQERIDTLMENNKKASNGDRIAGNITALLGGVTTAAVTALAAFGIKGLHTYTKNHGGENAKMRDNLGGFINRVNNLTSNREGGFAALRFGAGQAIGDNKLLTGAVAGGIIASSVGVGFLLNLRAKHLTQSKNDRDIGEAYRQIDETLSVLPEQVQAATLNVWQQQLADRAAAKEAAGQTVKGRY